MKEKSFLEQYYEENLAIFKRKTVQELIDAFNRQVGNKGWTGTRGAYGAALRKALDESGYSLDETVFTPNFTSYRRKIILDKGKIVPIN